MESYQRDRERVPESHKNLLQNAVLFLEWQAYHHGYRQPRLLAVGSCAGPLPSHRWTALKSDLGYHWGTT